MKSALGIIMLAVLGILAASPSGPGFRPLDNAAGVSDLSRPVVAQGPTRLWEFRTADRKGHFYTASEGEAGQAERQGFQRKPDQLGSMPAQSPTTAAVHRLRFVPHQAYLVTGDPAERQRLVGSGRFVDEGVLGHVHRAQQPGTVQLKRFSKDGDWRLAPASSAAQYQAAGYREDGPVGWVLAG